MNGGPLGSRLTFPGWPDARGASLTTGTLGDAIQGRLRQLRPEIHQSWREPHPSRHFVVDNDRWLAGLTITRLHRLAQITRVAHQEDRRQLLQQVGQTAKCGPRAARPLHLSMAHRTETQQILRRMRQPPRHGP